MNKKFVDVNESALIYENRERVRVLETELCYIKDSIDKILNNHLVHIQTSLEKIEEEISQLKTHNAVTTFKMGLVIGVIVFVSQLILSSVFSKFSQ